MFYNKFHKYLYWLPRLLGVGSVLFLTMFSLDVFEPGIPLNEVLIGLLIHNIPSLILLVLLIISWKHDLVGAVTFIGAGVLYIILLLVNPVFEWYVLSWIFGISGPLFVTGALFLTNFLINKRNML